MARKDELKDKRIGWLVSVGTHMLLLLLFIFIAAWREPNPPHPEYGIEINLGFEQAGSGYVQPETAPSPVVEDNSPSEVEEQVTQEVIEESQPAQEVEEETVIPEQIEELKDSEQEDSPVETLPEAKEQVTEDPVEEAPVKSAPEKTEEVVKKEQKPEVKQVEVNDRALYPNTGNQGKEEDQVGDAGDPEGTVDARALYGKKGGGGGGPSLDISGWTWDFIPKPDDQSSDGGKIVFEIKVDDRGEVIAVKTIERTVPPQVEQIYRREVEKLTFSPTSENTIPAPVSTGKITFIIRSK